VVGDARFAGGPAAAWLVGGFCGGFGHDEGILAGVAAPMARTEMGIGTPTPRVFFHKDVILKALLVHVV
jgi:hypothetical protein